MLRKLLKYDLLEIGQALLPIYGVVLLLAFVTGITYRFVDRNPDATFPAVVSWAVILLTLAFGILMAGMGIMTIFLIIKNFRENLFGSRGYLMNTLPVKTSSHVLDKTINGVLWTWMSLLVGLLSWVILAAAYTIGTGNLSQLLRELYETFPISQSERWRLFFQILVLLFFWSLEMIAKIFASLAIGNLWKNHRMLGGIIAFGSISILQSLFGNLLYRSGLTGAFQGSLAVFSSGDGVISARDLILAGIRSGLYTVLFSLISIETLKRKLNLE